jgi:nucleoside-diphosphate-sugar epimerase
VPNDTILITGAAGFIGVQVAQRLLSDGREVVGVDSVNDYYNPKLKEAPVELLKRNAKFTFVNLDLADRAAYGANTKLPFSVQDNVDHPISLYAASKKANDLMAHAYSHLYRIPATGLRFFTVYGPWGRPEMAMFIFAKAILASQPIKLFNHGKMQRDFTYIDDVSQAVVRLIDRPPQGRPD